MDSAEFTSIGIWPLCPHRSFGVLSVWSYALFLEKSLFVCSSCLTVIFSPKAAPGETSAVSDSTAGIFILLCVTTLSYAFFFLIYVWPFPVTFLSGTVVRINLLDVPCFFTSGPEEEFLLTPEKERQKKKSVFILDLTASRKWRHFCTPKTRTNTHSLYTNTPHFSIQSKPSYPWSIIIWWIVIRGARWQQQSYLLSPKVQYKSGWM